MTWESEVWSGGLGGRRVGGEVERGARVEESEERSSGRLGEKSRRRCGAGRGGGGGGGESDEVWSGGSGRRVSGGM